MSEQQHSVPKCLACGYIGDWKVEGLLLVRHWVIGIFLLPLFGAGLLYLILVAIVRAGKKNRSKICPQCKGRNMWTFMY